MIVDWKHHCGRLPDGRAAHWLDLTDAAGRTARGEVAPLPGFGMEPLRELPDLLVRAARRVSGESCPAGPAVLVEWLDGRLGADWPGPGARAALETALARLAAEAAGLSLARWLNPEALERVEVGCLLGTLEEGWERRLPAGRACLKVKAGRLPWQQEREALQRLRAQSPSCALRIDLNGRWSAEQLQARADELGALGPEYVEQPLAASQTESMIALAGRLPLKLAADESLTDPALRERLLEAGELVFVLKPATLGGPLSAWRLARRAAARGIDCVVTHFADGEVGRRMAADLALAVGGERAHGVDR